jgi:hypothetical protein
MKKNRIYILVFLLLLVITIVLYNKRGGLSSINKSVSTFSVEDTAMIDKIILSDKSGKVLTLSKKNKIWYGNDSVKVRRDIMATLLETIKRVQVKSPVAKPMRNNIMKQLATGAIQVEIFQDGDLEKKYFVGGPTMDGFGTFMLLDGADDPFITHIPGFEGYLTVRFNTNVLVWKDREVFRYAPQNISIIKIEYPPSKEASFTLKVEGKDYVSLVNDAGDTAKAKINGEFLRDYLLKYSDIQYENQADPKRIPNLPELLSQENLLAKITIFDKEGQKKSVELFKRYFDGEKFLPKSEEYDFDRDRCFLRINGKEVYNAQYNVFNKLIVSYKDFFSTPLQ